MRFSTTTEYALQIMSYLSIEEDKLYKADDIFNDLDIPHRYLRKLLTKLTKNGIIKSVQGKYGGYMISKELEDISLLMIVEASGESIVKQECFFGLNKCVFHNNCTLHAKWDDIQSRIINLLANTKLSDIKRGKPLFAISNYNQL